MTRAKPLFAALALALGASAPAFADEEHGGLRNRLQHDDAVSTTTTTTTVVQPAPAAGTPSTVIVSPAPESTNAARSEDARERAGRVITEEEEHGGLRNRIKAKKERTRERLGLGRDSD